MAGSSFKLGKVAYSRQNITSAAGTTTLTNSSDYIQYITGSTTQTVKLPDATTMVLALGFKVINANSAGNVTVVDNGSNTLATLTPGQSSEFIVDSISTSNGVWMIFGGASSSGVSGLAWQSVQTSNFNAVSGDAYPVNTTSGAITATLPASPSAGNIIMFLDYAGTFTTNNLTIANNGNKIAGIASNVIITTNRESIGLVYIDSTQGWLYYDGFNTSTPKSATYALNYLVVAGGGGGGSNGGGGAGGMLSGSSTLNAGTVYTVTVGGGGAGTPNNTSNATAGSNSVLSGSGFTTVTAVGGGIGALYPSGGGSGGSGGGASGNPGASGGSATAGQGSAGGTTASGAIAGSGGGGAGGVGGQGTSSAAGAGGVGLSSSITGAPAFYAGGGGSCGGSVTASGGLGGGGAGNNSGNGVSGTANTGGGGGGSSSAAGGNGGSGVVILSIATANYTGTTTGSPTVTTSGSNTIIKFTASGTYTA